MFIKICGITTPDDAAAVLEAGADFIGAVHYPKSPRHLTAARMRTILHAAEPFRKQGRKTVLVAADATAEEIIRILDAVENSFDYVQIHRELTDEEFSRFGTLLNEKHPVKMIRVIRTLETLQRLTLQQLTLQQLPPFPAAASSSSSTYSSLTSYSSSASSFLTLSSSTSSSLTLPSLTLPSLTLPSSLYLLELSYGKLPGGNGRDWDWAAAEPFCQKFPAFLAGGITPEKVIDVGRLAKPFGIDLSSGVEWSGGALNGSESGGGRKDIEKVRKVITIAKNCRDEERQP